MKTGVIQRLGASSNQVIEYNELLKASRYHTKKLKLFCKIFWGEELTTIVFKQFNGNYLIINATTNPIKRNFPKRVLNELEFKDILELRCWDRNRADINLILAKLGLEVYDSLKIVQKTNGVSFNDPVWFKFPGDTLTYNRVKSIRSGYNMT